MWQAFLAHLRGQSAIIILYRDKLDFKVRSRFQKSIPNVGTAVVFRPAQYAHIDEVTIVRQSPMPFEAGVRGQDHVGVVRRRQMVEEMRGTGRFPKEFVHPSRTAVA